MRHHGKPKPSVGYTYERTDQRGTVTEYTHHWDELTGARSRLRTLRGGAVRRRGRFQSIRYTRTMATPVRQSVDEYWKSIDHGVVIVKHTSTLSGGASTEVLVSIR